ncbi:hypothetical protein HK098_004430 [Nowakowskiella sp. JEL0407]|nr:hypothetical protein HK098_004430 [Nowakowskiella sp. JEL0407]
MEQFGCPAKVYLHLKPISIEDGIIYRAKYHIDDVGKTLSVESQGVLNKNGRKIYNFENIFDSTIHSNSTTIRTSLHAIQPTSTQSESSKSLNSQTDIKGTKAKDDETKIYSITIPLLRHFIVDGYNVNLVSLGLSGSGKTTVLFGKGWKEYSDECEVEGLIPAIAKNLFGTLKDENLGSQINKSNQGDKSYRFQLYGELIRDLIDPTKDGLKIHEDAQYGVSVVGSTNKIVDNAYDCLEILQKAHDNLMRVHDSETASNSFVFTIFELCRSESGLERNAKLSDTAAGNVVSNFMVVDTRGAEKFFEDPTRLIMSDGLHASKSPITLWNTMKAFGRPKPDQPICYDFTKSIATQLLSDSFGGNAITSFIVNIDLTPVPSSSVATVDPNLKLSKMWNKSVLNMSQMLRYCVGFPLSGDGNTREIVRRFRAQIQEITNATKLEVESYKAQNFDSAGSEEQIEELSRKLISSKKENEKLKQDCELISTRLHDFSARFTKIQEAKAALEEELLQSEEEKLKFHKALLDNEIESTQFASKSENTTTEAILSQCYLSFTNKILNLETEISVKQAAIDNLQLQNLELKKKLDISQSDKTELNMELESIRQKFETTKSDNDKFSDRNEELGIELLNLLNEKSKLIKEKEEKLCEIEKLSKHNDFLQSRLENTECQGYEITTEFQKLKHKNDEERAEFLDKKLVLEQRIIEIEREKLELEKKLTNSHKMQEMSCIDEKSKLQDKIEHLEAELQSAKLKNLEYKRKADVMAIEMEISQGLINDHKKMEEQLKVELKELEEQ